MPFKLGAEGQLTPSVLVYANYSRAFKDGAINLGAAQATPVRSESVNNIEFGFKTAFFDRRLTINGAIFHNAYTDLQISQLAGTVIALTNVPRSTINGAEIEVTARPSPGLTLHGSLGYLDGKLNQFSNSRILPGLAGGPVISVRKATSVCSTPKRCTQF